MRHISCIMHNFYIYIYVSINDININMKKYSINIYQKIFNSASLHFESDVFLTIMSLE